MNRKAIGCVALVALCAGAVVAEPGPQQGPGQQGPQGYVQQGPQGQGPQGHVQQGPQGQGPQQARPVQQGHANPAPKANPGPAAQPAPGPAARPAPAVSTAPMLIHDRRYVLSGISQTVCQAVVPYRGDVDFELEEDASKGLYWTIASYDPNICRVEIDHEVDGIWPFQHSKAEIELKGVGIGTTTVVFSYPGGQTFSVLLTVR